MEQNGTAALCVFAFPILRPFAFPIHISRHTIVVFGFAQIGPFQCLSLFCAQIVGNLPNRIFLKFETPRKIAHFVCPSVFFVCICPPLFCRLSIAVCCGNGMVLILIFIVLYVCVYSAKSHSHIFEFFNFRISLFVLVPISILIR